MRPSWCPWEKTALPVYSQHFLEKWMDHYCCTNAISICQKHQTSSYTELYLLHLNLLLYCLYQSISGEINLIFHCWNNCFYSVAKLVYVAIWCPFSASWMKCKHCLIVLGWELIRPTSLWDITHSASQIVIAVDSKIVHCHQLEMKLVTPVGILNCCSSRGKEILAKVNAVTLHFELRV